MLCYSQSRIFYVDDDRRRSFFFEANDVFNFGSLSVDQNGSLSICEIATETEVEFESFASSEMCKTFESPLVFSTPNETGKLFKSILCVCYCSIV